MPHNPDNPYCHHPPRPCICDYVGVLPRSTEDPSIAPALLEWFDARPKLGTLDAVEAWMEARQYFESFGVVHEFPATPGEFVELLDYAEPLFNARRSVQFDVSHAASDGTVDIVATDDPDLRA